jgi:RNA polymerase sigma factor (sigma-70 family)
MRHKRRRLNKTQQGYAEKALAVVQPAICAFVKRNPDLRAWIMRVDLDSVAHTAVCMAALTYKPEKSAVTTYFSSAIRHALYREVLTQQKVDGRYVPTEQILDPHPNAHRTRQEMRALKALRMLSASDRVLLEDRLIEQVTLEQLGAEQRCDPRTIQRRVQAAIKLLRAAESDLP